MSFPLSFVTKMKNSSSLVHLSGNDIAHKLEQKGIKPTANRILIYQMLYCHNVPLSLTRLEALMPMMDKSSIFRVLVFFLEHDVVHSFEDGRGILNYELCHESGACDHHDHHVHFYCECCQRSFCLSHTSIPTFDLPEGFVANNVSFVIKGVCKDCMKKMK